MNTFHLIVVILWSLLLLVYITACIKAKRKLFELPDYELFEKAFCKKKHERKV